MLGKVRVHTSWLTKVILAGVGTLYRKELTMKNFKIGLYGCFDASKLEREFRKGFDGVDACMYEDKKEVDLLAAAARERGFNWGVHFPLLKTSYKYRDPLFLSTEAGEREEALAALEGEAAYAAQMGARYILVHFPKPVIIGRRMDLSNWRFGGQHEWVREEEYSHELATQLTKELFSQLDLISNRYGIPILLENDAINSYFSRTSLLEDLLKVHSGVRMCLDIGRLHLQEQVDPDFDSRAFTEKMAPYTELIHLWNVNLKSTSGSGHYPVLPGQRQEDGWADIEGYLKIIIPVNPEVKILFEHRSDLITDDQLEACYRWVADMVDTQDER
jgi:sugar phosphate isomerase/epimerase